MKGKAALTAAVLTAFLLAGCGQESNAGKDTAGTREITTDNNSGADTAVQSGGNEETYMTITATKAKEIMDTETGYVILDVRTKEEYDTGHIEGAALLPVDDIEKKAEGQLTDKDQTILVYCRSGARSARAAAKLAKLGYTNIINFGGIIDWPFETVK